MIIVRLDKYQNLIIPKRLDIRNIWELRDSVSRQYDDIANTCEPNLKIP